MNGMEHKIRAALNFVHNYFRPVRIWKKSLPAKSIFVLAVVLFLGGGTLLPGYAYSVVQPDPISDLSTLPITFPAQSSELISYFNDIARPDDIVSFPMQFLSMLPEIKAGQTMVAFASWQEAEEIIHSIQTEIDWVLYNPEHWEHTPAAEQQNLPATVQNAAQFTHNNGLHFFLAPNRRFIDETLEEIAPHADALLLQGQRLQDDPEFFAAWMSEKIEVARSANPDLLIYVQVGANRGTPEVMLRAIQTVADQIDGIAIWSQPRTLGNLQAFIDLLRTGSQVLSVETISPTSTSIPPTPYSDPTSTASDPVPTLTSTPGGQRDPIESVTPICVGVMVISLGVLITVFALQLRKHLSGEK